MIDELFLYGTDEGLFKQVLKLSSVMEGRYHVSPNYGADLNTSNLESYIKDPAYGLMEPRQKYPITVCMPPKSRIVKINGQKWEEFYFNLFFLCNTFQTSNNQIKSIDKDTNTSKHSIPEDWNDMKACAAGFMETLCKLVRKKLSSVLNVDYDGNVITRVSKILNDRVSGVSLAFTSQLYLGTCELDEYDSDALDAITIPEFLMHPNHQQ